MSEGRDKDDNRGDGSKRGYILPGLVQGIQIYTGVLVLIGKACLLGPVQY